LSKPFSSPDKDICKKANLELVIVLGHHHSLLFTAASMSTWEKWIIQRTHTSYRPAYTRHLICIYMSRGHSLQQVKICKVRCAADGLQSAAAVRGFADHLAAW